MDCWSLVRATDGKRSSCSARGIDGVVGSLAVLFAVTFAVPLQGAEPSAGLPVESPVVRRICGPCHRPDAEGMMSRISYQRPRLDRFACRIEARELVASSWAAELPPLPREANLHGPSLAVANATAWLARAMERLGRESLRACLEGEGVLRGRG